MTTTNLSNNYFHHHGRNRPVRYQGAGRSISLSLESLNKDQCWLDEDKPSAFSSPMSSRTSGIAGSKEQQFIVICPLPDDETKTQLAIVTYERQYYGIERTEESTIDQTIDFRRYQGEAQNSKYYLWSFQWRIETCGIPCISTRVEGDTNKAHSNSRVRNRQKAILIGIVLLLAIMTGIWYFKSPLICTQHSWYLEPYPLSLTSYL